MLQRLPVIVGIGEITDRPDDPACALEPLALMAEALKRAGLDAKADWINRIDSLDIVHQVSWRYERTAQRLCERLGIQPARAVYGVTGGESPIRYLHEAALRLHRGESQVAAVVGAEAQYAVNKAKALAIDLPWTPIAKDVENPIVVKGRLNPIAIAHGAIRPIHVYPFYENAAHVAWNQTPREALGESSELWSRFASIAAENPFSWTKARFSPSEIATVTPDNRLICFPYTKHVVANPAVNQGAAIILTTREHALALGVAEAKLVYVWGGVSANEPRDYLQRDQYSRSDAQDVVLNAAVDLCSKNAATFDALELYSCFPCVPKMTRRLLDLTDDVIPTVTGGLSFFGAPLNNYMSHATCAMVRRIRERASVGLLYGQGEFVTKHHAVVIAREPSRNELRGDYNLQHEVDRRRGIVPNLLTDYSGHATIETHTVIYDRGVPSHGVIVARTPEGSRLMARVKGSDASGIATLTDPERSPIGLDGKVSRSENGLLSWS